MLRVLLNNKVEAINMDELKSDVRPFIKDKDRQFIRHIERRGLMVAAHLEAVTPAEVTRNRYRVPLRK